MKNIQCVSIIKLEILAQFLDIPNVIYLLGVFNVEIVSVLRLFSDFELDELLAGKRVGGRVRRGLGRGLLNRRLFNVVDSEEARVDDHILGSRGKRFWLL